MSADKIKFRCSSLGDIMTEPRKGETGLSATCKKRLVEVFVNEKYGREKDVQTKQMLKGLLVEEDAITLYSRLRKKNFTKNLETLNNEYIKGTPDLFEGESIRKAAVIIDVKSSYDIFTFFATTADALNKNYYWQMQGYMALTGAKQARLVYCLINTPDVLVNDEKRRLQWKMNILDDESPMFEEACIALDKLMKYDDIPISERALEIVIDRADFDIKKIYSRVEQCRTYMNSKLFKSDPSIILASHDKDVDVIIVEATKV